MKMKSENKERRSKTSAAEAAGSSDGFHFRKRDQIVPVIIAAAILVVWLCFNLRGDAEGGVAVVTVGGEEYGSYSLDEDQEIPICIDGTETNLLIIEDGAADMTEADCPDQICVNHKAISKEHETIVCLPNEVVVEIVGGADSGLDATAN